MAKLSTETSWDTTPTTASVYEIYDAEDSLIYPNGKDATQKYNTGGFTPLRGDAPIGDHSIIYKDRLFLAGDPSYPHRTWFSHIRNGEGWSRNEDWIDFYPEDGGVINGMATQNDELIVSKDNGRKYGYRIFDDGDPAGGRKRRIEDDKGDASERAGTTMEDVHYFLDRNGLFTLPRSRKGGISYIVQEVIDAITEENLKEVAMGSNDGKVYIALGDVTFELGDTVTFKDAMLVYDSVNDAFHIRDRTNATSFTRFIDSGGREKLYFGTKDGVVYKMEDGNLAGQSPISMRIRTKPYFREEGRRVTVTRVGIYMDDPGNTLVSYRMHPHEKFRNIGHIVKEPVEWFTIRNASGSQFQMEFTHFGRNARPTLLGFTIDYHFTGDTRDARG